jgi:hypothetical protein
MICAYVWVVCGMLIQLQVVVFLEHETTHGGSGRGAGLWSGQRREQFVAAAKVQSLVVSSLEWKMTWSDVRPWRCVCLAWA